LTAPLAPAPVLNRPFAEASCLAGFIAPEALSKHVPLFTGLPSTVQSEITAKLGTGFGTAPLPNAGKPEISRVTEGPVLDLLTRIALQLPAPSQLEMSGFEWVEIKPLLAGRLLTQRFPWPEECPSPTDFTAVANFCMLSFSHNPLMQIVNFAGMPALLSPVQGTVQYVGTEARENGYAHRYLQQPSIKPIHIMIAEDRAVALTGIERLVALARLGVERALCMVAFGYGSAILKSFPSTPLSLLAESRAPTVGDFLDSSLSVIVPVRSPVAVTLFPQQSFGLE
jgi:hypothetical protein